MYSSITVRDARKIVSQRGLTTANNNNNIRKTNKSSLEVEGFWPPWEFQGLYFIQSQPYVADLSSLLDLSCILLTFGKHAIEFQKEQFCSLCSPLMTGSRGTFSSLPPFGVPDHNLLPTSFWADLINHFSCSGNSYFVVIVNRKGPSMEHQWLRCLFTLPCSFG